MNLSLVTAPAAELLTLEEAKEHLRVDGDTENDLIARLIKAAGDHFDGKDGILRRSLITQTWDLTLDCFPGVNGKIRLPLPPVRSITSITYVDSSGIEQTMDASDYMLIQRHGVAYAALAYEKEWPDARWHFDAITVRYVAGYGDAATDVADDIRSAVLLLLSDLYHHRSETVMGATVEATRTINALIDKHRVL